jgi:universal stress protein A
MAPYRHILLAVDLTEDSLHLATRANGLAKTLAAELELLHVVEPVPLVLPHSPEVMAPMILQSQDESVLAARAQLLRLAAAVGLTERKVTVRVGNTKSEIIDMARERGVDLIVLGSRERHGLSVLIPLTEDSVLHGAPCDVLAIRVKRSS